MKSSKLCKPAPFLLVALCVAIAGCGSSAVRKDSDQLMKEGQYEAGIARLEDALRDDPRDTELNIALAHSRQAAVEALLTQADTDRIRHDFANARMGYGRVLTLEPNNRRAQEGTRQLELIRTLDERVASWARRLFGSRVSTRP